MQPRERVHVVPLGYEKDRIVLASKQLKAERVILLEEPGERQPEWFQEVRDDLEELGIAVETESCNIFDMYSVIKAVARICQRHSDDDVSVNISTGSKLSAIGGMIACMSTGAATPYYVEPEYYGTEKDGTPEPVSHGVADIRQLTEYPIDGPSEQEIWVLEYLKQNQGNAARAKKRDLIDLGRAEEEVRDGFGPKDPLPFIREYSDNETAQYRVLNDKIIAPLLENGWIETDEKGNRTYVDITDEGINTLRAFRHLIEDI